MSQLQPLLVHPGIGELLALHRVDAVTTGRSLASAEYCETILRDTPPEQLNPPPLITGDDLQAVGMKPGPQFKRILDAVRESGGCAIAVTEDEMNAAWREMAAATGLFCAPEGAATLAALHLLLARGTVARDERIVLFNTGSGLKYLEAWNAAAP